MATISKAKRDRILKSWGSSCIYCGCKLDQENFTVDHVIPLSSGGSNNISNLVPACIECNRKKANKTIRQFMGKDKEKLKQIEDLIRDKMDSEFLRITEAIHRDTDQINILLQQIKTMSPKKVSIEADIDKCAQAIARSGQEISKQINGILHLEKEWENSDMYLEIMKKITSDTSVVAKSIRTVTDLAPRKKKMVSELKTLIQKASYTTDRINSNLKFLQSYAKVLSNI